MTWKGLLSVGALMVLAACSTPGPVRVLQPLAIAERGQVQLADVDVTISQTAAELVARHDAKAAASTREGVAGPDGRLAREDYDTLPLTEMFPLVLQDVLRERGIVGGRPVRLAVTIDTLKTANAGMAWLAGSSDQLAGLVVVHDAMSNEKLSEFYVDVINNHAGLLGLAMRGGGIRERLATEFAGHVAEQLGRQDRPRS